MSKSEDWSSNANECIHLRLQRHDKEVSDGDDFFNPTFTYPIFGEEEAIFGYKDLVIDLTFAPDTLRPTLNISYEARFEDVGDTKADDVEGALAPFLPPSIAKDSNGDASHPLYTTTFQPPGQQVHNYDVDGVSFGIWTANLTDTMTKELYRNLQTMVPMFIEGGTLLELDDPDWTIERWTVFFVYAIDQGPQPKYSLVGYATTYRLFFLDTTIPSSTPMPPSTSAATFTLPSDPSIAATLPSRQRISQFLILPPYQSQSHGSRLYDALTTFYLGAPNIHEISVEDPNETFDNLRDLRDLRRLRADPTFASLSISASPPLPTDRAAPFPTSSLLTADTAPTRRAAKMPARQFARLVEMHLLSRIPPQHRSAARITRRHKAQDPRDRAYYFWRLLVKARLYRQNKDVLALLEPEERVEKLEGTLAGIEAEYVRVLEAAEAGGREEGVDGGAGGKGRATKRRVVDEDEDEDEDEELDEEGDGPGGGKRARFA